MFRGAMNDLDEASGQRSHRQDAGPWTRRASDADPVETAAPGYLLLAAVALLSAATLGYEVLLTRLLAIVQWHHFAFLVISIALLGFGASGAFLVVAGHRLRIPAGPFLAISALAFAITAPACFAIAQRLPFNVLELPWSLRPLGWLLVIEILLAIPFFIAAVGIGRTLIVFGDRLARVYAADLAGAGGGAVLAVGLLSWFPAERALDGLVVVAALAGGMAAGRARPRTRWAVLAPAAVILVYLSPPMSGTAFWHDLRISQFKPLPQALRVNGATLGETRSGPLGVVSAVENEKVPLRWAPGLSLLARAPVPEQVALFVDGDGPIAIPRSRPTAAPPAYLGDLPSALPYHLLQGPRVLVLGAGGGAPVLQALGGEARGVDAVELQPAVAALARDRYRRFSGGALTHPTVRLHVGDPRAFVEAARGEKYDLIQMDALGASPSGIHALRAERLLTVESMRTTLARLAPRGLVAITGWSELPPRSGPRLLATLLEALAAEGIGPAGEHLAWIRSWNTYTLVASRAPLSLAQVAAVRAFARARAFDLVHVPGMEADEANRYNVMEHPWLREAAVRLLGPEREDYIRGYKFDIRPATDDRPYLWSFFRWAHAPEILSLSREGGIGLLAIGYLALPAALVQAMVASAAFILLPLLFIRRRSGSSGEARRGAALAGFFALGLAFLMMEIAFISRFTVILSHPLHALVVVLAAFLVFAGIGSWLAGRRSRGDGGHGSVILPAAGIVALAAIYVAVLPDLTSALLGAAPPVKIASAAALVAPLATLMGMPFPRALARLRRLDPGLVPWAWGVNGCASVTGAVLATGLAIHLGQTFVIGSAALLYAAAALALSHIGKLGRRG